MFIDADRVWSNLLIGTFFLLTIGLGGAVFVALNYVTGAGWSAAFRRVPELLGYRSLAQSVDVIHPAYLFEMIHVQHFQ
jgi:hypothetical protein